MLWSKELIQSWAILTKRTSRKRLMRMTSSLTKYWEHVKLEITTKRISRVVSVRGHCLTGQVWYRKECIGLFSPVPGTKLQKTLGFLRYPKNIRKVFCYSWWAHFMEPESMLTSWLMVGPSMFQGRDWPPRKTKNMVTGLELQHPVPTNHGGQMGEGLEIEFKQVAVALNHYA